MIEFLAHDLIGFKEKTNMLIKFQVTEKYFYDNYITYIVT